MLTLSNSSTIRGCIRAALCTLPHVTLNIDILESRPRFEGADMAAQILSSTPAASKQRIRIRILPDCAVASAAKTAHVVLLGADRISASGDVSNKIGSLPAALCVRHMNPKAQVVVISDVDKIAAQGAGEEDVETHAVSEMAEAWRDESRRGLEECVRQGSVRVFGEWFEWVPADLVDMYVTENGILDREGVEKVAKKVGELKTKVFGIEQG